MENVVDGALALTTADEQDSDAIVPALLTPAVFTLPAVIATTKPGTQSVIHLLRFSAAEWLLYFWTILDVETMNGYLPVLTTIPSLVSGTT